MFWTFWWPLVDLLRTVFKNFWGLCEDHLMNIWGTFDDYRNLRTLITFWGIEVAWIPFVDLWGLRRLWWPFEEFEDIVRISWEPEVWVPWVPFIHFPYLLWTLWTFWGLFEDQRTWCSQNIEEHFRNIWWLLLYLLRTWGLWGIQGLFRTSRIFANLITYWGIEDVDKLLRYLRSPWIPFVDLWGLRGLCGPFEDFWKTCEPEDLKALKNFLGLLMTSCGPFEDLSPLRNSRTFQDIEDLCEPDYLLRNWGRW